MLKIIMIYLVMFLFSYLSKLLSNTITIININNYICIIIIVMIISVAITIIILLSVLIIILIYFINVLQSHLLFHYDLFFKAPIG